MIVNLPVGLEATERRIMQHLIDKARSKFRSVSQSHSVLEGSPRLQTPCTRNGRVRCRELGVGALFLSRQLQQMINHFECRCVRHMMGLKRGRGELWLDWEKRSMRMARSAIPRFAERRWEKTA